MKVNLINPPQLELYEPSAYQPLGLLYIGAVLNRDGFECSYVDLSDKEEIQVADADYHLITVNSATYGSSKKVMQKIAHGFKVAGGFHPSLFPNESLKQLNLDAVVVGEGENVITRVLRDRKRGIFNGGVIKDLDSIPFPARELVPIKKLRNLSNIHGDSYKGDGAATTIITSRGCPYRCAFCSKALKQTRYFRYRSPINIYNELKEVQEKYDIHHFRFIDDCFTVNVGRVHRLCKLIKNLDICWLCITRTDAVNRQLLTEMYEAGCREIHYGIESGSQRLLDLMNKQVTVETNLYAVKIAKEAGLKVKIFLMYGFPTEKTEDIELTKKFVLKAQPDKWTLSKFALLPGSDVWNNPTKYGLSRGKSGRGSNLWYYPEESFELKHWLIEGSWKK